MIPLTRPFVSAPEVDACARVLASGMLVQGAEVQAFEAALAAATARTHAVAVSNGTEALVLALRALGIAPGDHVLCPALTWPSPAHAVRLLGAVPVLVDVDAQTWNTTPAAFAEARTERTRCAIAIDQFGAPADHAGIAAALPGVLLVIDGACSLGASLHGRPALADGLIACTSFHPRKIITTGEGGACLTDDPLLDRRLRTLRNHGQVTPGVFTEAASNARMTELQAAMGSAQLTRLADIVARRVALRTRMLEALPELNVQQSLPGASINGQTFGLCLGPKAAHASARDGVLAALAAGGVMAGTLSYALAELPQFQTEKAQAVGRSLAASARLAEVGLALPLYPTMTEADVAGVVAAVRRVIVDGGFA
jgi:perosamine synthetase